MDEKTLTHKDLSRLLKVSETTVKSYRAKFGEFIPLHSRGKPLRFKPQAAEVCLRIRGCFLDNRSVEEIREILAESYPLTHPLAASKRRGVALAGTPALGSEDLDPDGDRTLTLAVARLARLQEETAERLNAVQARLEEVLERLAASTTGVDAGKARGAPEFQSPQAAQSGSRAKRVVVRNIMGWDNEYLIHSAPDQAPVTMPEERVKDPRAPSPAEAPQKPLAPPEGLLRLPLVVKSELGEFLGVAGKSERSFSLADLERLMEKTFPPPHDFALRWSGSSDSWRMQIAQTRPIKPQSYALEVEEAQTPRGNRVALLSRFEVDGLEVPPPNLYVFIKQMKERLLP